MDLVLAFSGFCVVGEIFLCSGFNFCKFCGRGEITLTTSQRTCIRTRPAVSITAMQTCENKVGCSSRQVPSADDDGIHTSSIFFSPVVLIFGRGRGGGGGRGGTIRNLKAVVPSPRSLFGHSRIPGMLYVHAVLLST